MSLLLNINSINFKHSSSILLYHGADAKPTCLILMLNSVQESKECWLGHQVPGNYSDKRSDHLQFAVSMCVRNR